MFFILVVVLSLARGTVCAEAELKLIRELMTHYDPDVRPSENVTEAVDVSMDMTLHQIIEVNARDQVLTSSVWQRMYWTDDHLRWEPSEYGGLDKIRLSAKRIWKPDVALVNDVRSDSRDQVLAYPATVWYTGEVKWLAPRLLQTSCTLDMTYFPWDSQTCILEFASWSHDISELVLHNVSVEADDTDYLQNGEWDLVGLPIERRLVFTPCCDHPFTFLDFEVNMRRKARYYIGNLIFPSALITAAGMLVFCLPTESGEKVSLSVTILLATTVFQLVLADNMPVQSLTTPIIGRYMMCTQILLGLSTTLTVFVINIYHQGSVGHKVPSGVKAVVKILASILCLGTVSKTIWGRKGLQRQQQQQDGGRQYNVKVSQNNDHENKCLVNNLGSCRHDDHHDGRCGPSAPNSDNSAPGGLHSVVMRIAHTLDRFDSVLTEQEVGDNRKLEWMFVSAVLDRLFLILFAVSTCVCSLTLLMGHGYYRN